eukprot:125772-Chlamydomonas_euryale.AAC.3
MAGEADSHDNHAGASKACKAVTVSESVQSMRVQSRACHGVACMCGSLKHTINRAFLSNAAPPPLKARACTPHRRAANFFAASARHECAHRIGVPNEHAHGTACTAGARRSGLPRRSKA